ncbi:MAG: BatD family protein, partial [Gammaproteobacteria bacterium]
MIRRVIQAASMLAALLLPAVALSQQIETSVDRSELARGETLTYTIRVFDQRQGMQLDLTPLTDDFDVLGTRTSSQIRSINGAVESWTDYIVTLFPLGEGNLTIPPIQVNDATTEAIEIVVSNEGPRSNQNSDELFLEIETNKDSIYVQEQLLFTVRLYYTINGIRNPQFTELEMPDSVIQLIGSPNQFEQLIDGVRYGVYEKRYVIFPQRSGDLQIPDILFRGEVTDGSSNFVFRNLNTRRVTAFIEGVTIAVKERPASARDSEFWLPVSNLELEETWSSDLGSVRIGDTIERTVTMTAHGLDGAVLPPFSASPVSGANQYPNPPEIDRSFVEGSIVGTRTESVSMVATEAGLLEIPQIAIPWWNVDTDQAEVTVVPATRIEIANVQGAAPSEQAVASSQNLAELLAADPVVDQAMIDAQAQAEFIEVESNWLNYFIILACVIVAWSVYSLALAPNWPLIAAWYRQRRTQLSDHYDPANNEAVAFSRLKKACASRNLNRIRAALILWCNHFLDSRAIMTMEDILQQREVSELHEHALAMQSTLFQPDVVDPSAIPFDAPRLVALVKRLRR